MSALLTNARLIEEDLIALRREFHRSPEPGGSEYATAARVEQELQALGIEVRRVADTGVVGILTGAHPGRCVALRADMDALPITEQTQLPFASQNAGTMHACGHDMHTAALIGAAKLLAAQRDSLCGTVKFFFQPDEEGDGGAQRMIDAGCMEGVDAVFGAHVEPELPVGTVGVRYGSAYAASNPFDIVVRGRSSHGAEPHLGVDAIVAASAIVGNLQTLVSRNLSPVDSAVVSIGSFHAGTARNIIADEARLSGIIRCFGHEMRTSFAQSLTGLVESTAAALGASAEITIHWGYAGIINDHDMTALVQNSANALLGSEKVIVQQHPTLTTEDFGAFLEHAPGSYWHIGVGRPGGNDAPLHSPFFNPDESVIALAAALHAKIALDFLNR